MGELHDAYQKEKRIAAASTTWSRVRENLIEHVFISELLQEAWFVREQRMEVLRAEVDAFGYDLVLECNGILRHVQLKASERSARTRTQTINVALQSKAGACVVWIVFWRDDPDAVDRLERAHELRYSTASPRLAMQYLYFGGRRPRDGMPPLGDVVGRNPRTRSARQNTRVLHMRQFDTISTTAALADRMFGKVRRDERGRPIDRA